MLHKVVLTFESVDEIIIFYTYNCKVINKLKYKSLSVALKFKLENVDGQISS